MAVAQPTPAPPRPASSPLLTSEEFLAWLQPGLLADLVGGQTVMHSPVSLRHARLLNFLDHLLRQFLEHRRLGELHRETLAVRLSVRETFLPDLAYFTAAQTQRLSPTHAPFAPTLVVEALSPTAAAVDRGRKFAAYELHGVQEYWILDPDNRDHHFYRREGDMLVEFAVDADRIEAQSIPGFWIERAWLNPGRLPRVSDCLTQVLNPTARRSRRTHR